MSKPETTSNIGPKKAGLYMNAWSSQVLHNYTQGGRDNGSLSEHINAMIERYDWIMRYSLPDMTAEQWQMLLNVYAGSEMTSYHPPYRIASDIMDCYGVLELSELDASLAETVRQIHAMSQAQQCAILDACQRFWCAPSDERLKDGEDLKQSMERLSKTDPIK